MIECDYFANLRHGDAFNNVAERQHKNGDKRAYDEAIKVPSSMHDLTEEGIREAIKTGEWLRKQKLTFRRHIVSEHLRALRTAFLLNISGATWELDARLGEKDTGILNELTPEDIQSYFSQRGNNRHELDRYRFRADRGESFLDLWGRVAPVFASLTAGTLVVGHGHVMRVIDHVMRGRSVWEFDHTVEIPNCALIEYYRRGNNIWMRRISIPCHGTLGEWEEMPRAKYSNEDLLA